MKQAILFLALFISAVSFGQQKVTAPLVRNAPTDTTYAILADTLLYGGHQFVNDTLVRNAIPIAARKKGMWVTVANTGVTYKLSDNLGSWGIVSFGADSSVFATLFKVRQDSLVLAAATAAKPSFGDVRDIVSDSVMGKVNKWERWADTLFIQKFDSTKVPLTIQVDTNYINNPTIRVIDSLNRVLFELRALPIKFASHNLAIGIDAGKRIRPTMYDSPVYGLISGGSGNTLIGDSTGRSLVDGNGNTGVGSHVLEYLLGANGGDPNFNGSLNTAMGDQALRFLTTGTSNSTYGQKAGEGITIGTQNTIMGKAAGQELSYESGNAFYGVQAGKFGHHSRYSLKIGTNTGLYQGGGYNIAIGTNAADDTLYYAGGPMYVQNTFIAGGTDTTSGIYDVYFGNGAFSRTNARGYKIRGTNGYGTNINGGNVDYYGGLASGTGTGGSLRFFTGQSIASGTQQQFTVERMRVNGSNGYVGINDTLPTEMLSINGGTGAGLTYGKVKFAMNQISPQVKFYNYLNGSNYYPWYLSTGRGTRGRAFSIMNGAASAVGSESMSDALTIDTLGVVGIGTATPVSTTKLEIQKNSASATTTNALRLTNNYNTTGTGVSLEFMTNPSVIGSSITGYLESGAGPQHSMRLAVQGSDMMHIENGFFGSHMRINTGRVGIGTSSNATTLAALHVQTSALNQLRLGYDASNYVTTAVSSTGGVTYDAFGAGQKFNFIDSVVAPALNLSGQLTGTNANFTTNLGIGTATPTASLEVYKAGIGISSKGGVFRDNVTPTYGSNADNLLTVRGTGNSTATWRGRVVAGGDNNSILMGEFNSQAWLGAHNSTLSAWADVYISPDGTTQKTHIGSIAGYAGGQALTVQNSNGFVGVGVTTPLYKFDVNGLANFRSRILGTSLKLNKDSVAFATAASKITLIDTVTGLATKANIGTGLSLSGGTLSATTNIFGGTISATVTAATTFVVTIPTQANNTYQISVQGGNMASTGGWVTNKTTTSFDYVVPTAITGTVTFDWILKP